VKSLSVVIDVDVLEERAFEVAPCFPALTVDQLLLEGCEEAFCDCIVPAVSLTTHAYHDTSVAQVICAQCTRILAASIRMMGQWQPRFALRQCAVKRAQRERRVDGVRNRPADHLAREQNDDGTSAVGLPVSFIGNLTSNASASRFGIVVNAGNTFLRRLAAAPAPFQSAASWNGVAGWTPTKLAKVNVVTGGNVELVAAPNAKKFRCFITGIGGDWQTVSANGTVQPYAQVCPSGTAIRFRVGGGSLDSTSAEATCIRIQL
jgi:hypothetical protein